MEDWNRLVRSAGGRDTIVNTYMETNGEGKIIEKLSLGAGKTLKSTTGWNMYNDVSGNGTDNFGFSALPGGVRNTVGEYSLVGYGGFWWSATEDDRGFDDVWLMLYNFDDVAKYYNRNTPAHSVRCVQ